MSQVRDALRRLGTLDWLVIGLGFGCAFFLALSTGQTGSAMRWLAVLCGLGAIGVLAYLIWTRREAADHGRDWDAFETALPEGVAIDVPDGLSYAATLPELTDELEETGEPPFDGAPGHARNAIFGERDRIHYCAFQYHRDGRVDTIGLVALRPDREIDVLPDVAVTVVDPKAVAFGDRFRVSGYDDEFTAAVLSEPVQADLMAAPPFSWKLIGNQILTVREGPSDPQTALRFIDERLEPLAQVASSMPARAGLADEVTRE
ncbi:hypothetical protein EK0264_09850 [Epidermidibacterium keratini]|uniref:DUF3137 domain-containing protein n=1 Tax=Epidermidibacterium keratini TaxID=1891644 RepID=A0A7L4YMP7_9ACTN|nr:hypothetical protein [Epidermidibacterium keratini]QHC00561.1 hypothetical protein EK0264_09850 [Epidermidibacterium keratini]